MAQADEINSSTTLAPLVITRSFAAPRALVFKAWSSADHMRRWFSPECFTVPQAHVDFRPGGVCDICMRSPDGQDFWSRGHYVDIVPNERIVLTGGVGDEGQAPRFTVTTTVTFEDEGEGARITVRQVYDIHDPSALGAVGGAPEGWRTTLDKLEREVARIQEAANRQVVHGVFTLERTYAASPAKVFHALSDPQAKARWFASSDGLEVLEREMDVRPGGRERVKGRWPSGMVSEFSAVYHDVITDERLIYAYEMTLDGRKISVSLASLELKPEGEGTRLIVTEQGAFLDGYDDAGSREHGTGFLLDQLGVSLKD